MYNINFIYILETIYVNVYNRVQVNREIIFRILKTTSKRYSKIDQHLVLSIEVRVLQVPPLPFYAVKKLPLFQFNNHH